MQKGFTFVEILTVVAILALLGAMVVPGMQEFMRNSRMAGLTDNIQNSLAVARSSAITQRRTVVWVRTTSPDGWEVRWDSPAGLIISEQRLVSTTEDFTIVPSVATPSTPVTQIRFEQTGLIKRHDSNTAMDFEFRVCSNNSTSETGRSVRMSRLGRLMSGKHSGSTGTGNCN